MDKKSEPWFFSQAIRQVYFKRRRVKYHFSQKKFFTGLESFAKSIREAGACLRSLNLAFDRR